LPLGLFRACSSGIRLALGAGLSGTALRDWVTWRGVRLPPRESLSCLPGVVGSLLCSTRGRAFQLVHSPIQRFPQAVWVVLSTACRRPGLLGWPASLFFDWLLSLLPRGPAGSRVLTLYYVLHPRPSPRRTRFDSLRQPLLRTVYRLRTVSDTWGSPVPRSGLMLNGSSTSTL